MSAEPVSIKARPCPLCGKSAVHDFRPFCSRGCRDRDLNGWFDEDYRIPVPPGADEGDDPEGTP
jgi:endogenous inhibitor of DNA gyrase (YacG/DUF329 family)